MWNGSTEQRAAIEEISKDLVTQLAPEELDLFGELAQDYFDDPKPLSKSKHSDDPLGFGIFEAMTIMTPVAMAMASTVLTFVTTEVIKSAKDESAAVIKKKIKALFNKADKQEADSPSLTKEQMEQVKKLAYKQATDFGMDAATAEKMSNALIGSLALNK
ncbi:hypothetical protein HY772_09720 [Candidatus Woesearchaeota archaeon]|nr:hypothetical protein [Candidatus Woesearchaeota archaeon]